MATNQPHTKRDEGGQGDKRKAGDGQRAKDSTTPKSQTGSSKGKNDAGGKK